MKFVLSGVETKNKGAELMLYAILQEIERKFPNSEVFIPADRIFQGKGYIKCPLKITLTYEKKWKSLLKVVLFKLNIDYPVLLYPSVVKNADYFIDASGLLFSDKMIRDKYRLIPWKNLVRYKKQKTKIIFLPQAFGPLETILPQKSVRIISDNANLVFARENVSYRYIVDLGIRTDKIKVCTDFTSLVDGIFPQKYERLRSGVCIIPNRQMVKTGVMDLDSYVSFLSFVVTLVKNKGFQPYMLNHEGRGDDELMSLVKKDVNFDLETVSDLNALEVKGLIGSAYLCISSRYHGVANSLNGGVPCLATSWSHKYAELFKDYGLDDCLLDMFKFTNAENKISEFLQPVTNQKLRSHLVGVVPKIKEKTRNMWNLVWNCD